ETGGQTPLNQRPFEQRIEKARPRIHAAKSGPQSALHPPPQSGERSVFAEGEARVRGSFYQIAPHPNPLPAGGERESFAAWSESMRHPLRHIYRAISAMNAWVRTS